MNLKRDLIDRALAKAGQNPLTDEDIKNVSLNYETVKLFYLSTMLETLSSTDWTEAKTRKKLVEAEEENLTNYGFKYLLPVDCAKPLQVQDNDLFIIEGKYLYTNRENAILLYITNGRIEKEEDFLIEEDFPDYQNLQYGDAFWEYIETRLASKIALKITGDIQLYQLLFSESQLLETEAQKTSRSQSRSKPKGNPYWSDIIGVGSVNY
jgi:hypothetical protein